MSAEESKNGRLFMGIEIEINSGCNKACSYCPNADHQRVEQGHMEESLYLILLKQLQDINYKGRICYHFYNEPMISPQLERFVSLSKKYLPQTRSELFTNGTLLSLKRFEALEKAGMDRFTVTKHEETPNFIFEKTYSKLDNEQRKKVKLGEFESLIYTNRGGLLDVGEKLRELPLQLPCYIPSCSLVVTLKGNVVTCYEDFYQKSVMGNIKETHIRDIWFSKEYVHFRESLKKGNRKDFETCSKCNNLQIVQ